VGIALALSCEAAGLSVLLLEAGDESDRTPARGPPTARIVDERRHAPVEVSVRTGFGGTSRWWGGRCVPYDDIDFLDRVQAPNAAWPIQHAELSRWYPAAAEFFGCGPAKFRAPLARWSRLNGATFEALERWAPHIDMGEAHRKELAASTLITVVLGASVSSLELGPDSSAVVRLMVVGDTATRSLAPVCCVLTCGGLESARLLLAAQQAHPDAFGGADGPLGRHYMGHISGKIADLVLDDPSDVDAHDFFLDGPAYARRRFAIDAAHQVSEGLLNASLWIDNPPFQDPDHRSGLLSLVWAALTLPVIGRLLVSEGVRRSHVGGRSFAWTAHLANVLRSPIATVWNLGRLLMGRYFKRPRLPGFLIRNASGRYALHYHGEHLPNPDSRVWLSDDCDTLGRPRLNIDLQYSDADARSVLRNHELLDRSLREAGLGRLEYRMPAKERLASVLAQASDGFHQIGLVRMGSSPDTSVVGPDCRVHGISNLYVVSTGVFPSSGQANPTFPAVALALRVAHALAARIAPDQKAAAT